MSRYIASIRLSESKPARRHITVGRYIFHRRDRMSRPKRSRAPGVSFAIRHPQNNFCIKRNREWNNACDLISSTSGILSVPSPASKVTTKPQRSPRLMIKHKCARVRARAHTHRTRACVRPVASKIHASCVGYVHLDVDVHNSFCLEYLRWRGEPLGNPSQPSYIE